MVSTVQILLNGAPREAPADTTIAGLLEQLRFEPRRVAIEVNQRLVPREQHAEYVLREGDQLEIVTLAGGG